ncbi:serine hydrolase [Chryseobacterium sp. Tr-659]|uniref:serine hydrolase n=1 Tax=Chryseobacterium sp. Tr-659 TaxID=2608340 RepID=UPI00142153D4|nr:serine hydrolase [Chryseobacterium sp. Tr-659]NIF06654.1 serine hydrolase [Chryseobacterium sp. Tr-659]
MKNILFVYFLLLSIGGFSQKLKNSKDDLRQNIDAYLRQVRSDNQIPGLAAAVIKNGKIIYEGYYGKASLAPESSVNKNTLFGIFSTTKLISTVGVFQLIEKNKLNLNDPVSKYIDHFPGEWEKVTIKNLLTHSSGIPDVVRFEDIPPTLSDDEKLQKLSQKPMQFETGNQFRYNQTNYWLLTIIIEKITGKSFDDYIVDHQFPLAKTGVVFSSDRGEFIKNRAYKYDYDNQTDQYVRNIGNDGIRAHSGNGLNLSLSELIQWNDRLDKNELLKKETIQMMWTPFEFKNKKDHFLYGWAEYPLNKNNSYGFSGGNVTAFRKFPSQDMTIIFLSNGYRYFDVQDQVINHIAGMVDQNLADHYLLSDEKITSDFLNIPYQNAEKNYLKIKNENPGWNFERRLNSIGYALMKNHRIDDAIKVFELNTKQNPDSGDAFDSLGEGYFTIGKYEISKKYYEKSLKLSPQNENAKEMLLKIERVTTK